MKIGDKVFSVKYNKIVEIASIEEDNEGFSYTNYLFNINNERCFGCLYDFLTLEQIADIFANKELEQLILNYKK